MDPTVHEPCGRSHPLRAEEERQTPPLRGLQGSQQGHPQESDGPPFDHGDAGPTIDRPDLHKAGPQGGLPPDPHPTGRRVEDRLSDEIRPLRVSRHALRPHQRARHLPELYQQDSRGPHRLHLRRLPRRYLHLQRRPDPPLLSRPPGARAPPRGRPRDQPREVRMAQVRNRVPRLHRLTGRSQYGPSARDRGLRLAPTKIGPRYPGLPRLHQLLQAVHQGVFGPRYAPDRLPAVALPRSAQALGRGHGGL